MPAVTHTTIVLRMFRSSPWLRLRIESSGGEPRDTLRPRASPDFRERLLRCGQILSKKVAGKRWSTKNWLPCACINTQNRRRCKNARRCSPQPKQPTRCLEA
ncbi:hypothetical protein TGPRC2_238165 [Toxoplasma gondii TgCatPRC2]|uniref:Uncharacterized protein n=3 Tax=Toxoplasma gondii TaxID=5811 RepID=A0A151H051_TOXGO|nr:hypothetical protein TGVAND_238165 [Toxoplasma gondii VAND]KFH02807.1 hypothetical protein TGMAS_238165 [Toxoplasma gondii MAS]KYK62750.1 hypothetical protein TGPRC2_238165 [Toxoplasma gondii TgCatPRC2]